MDSILTSLLALQRLDTAAETARRRLADMPTERERLAEAVRSAAEAVDKAKARVADNNTARRELEKQVAAVDSRLARFDEHKAAVKTNHEYTALLHEIETAKSEKDGIEDQILGVLEDADVLVAGLKAAEAELTERTREEERARAALDAEAAALTTEVERLLGEKRTAASGVDPTVLARYEQLLKQRRMLAVAPIQGETCGACHVRLRPAMTQQIRRSSDIVQCESCQRILYFEPPTPESATASATP